MKKITIPMPDELARKTRILAAEADTSMSQFLCNLVAEKAVSSDEYKAAMKRCLSRKRGGVNLAGQKLPTREELQERHALR